MSEEFCDIYVEFMKMGAISFNAWAANKVQCWFFTVIILCIIRALLDVGYGVFSCCKISLSGMIPVCSYNLCKDCATFLHVVKGVSEK